MAFYHTKEKHEADEEVSYQKGKANHVKYSYQEELLDPTKKAIVTLLTHKQSHEGSFCSAKKELSVQGADSSYIFLDQIDSNAKASPKNAKV
jgi:hypothetical protein